MTDFGTGKTWSVQHKFEASHLDSVWATCFSPHYLLSGSIDGTLKVREKGNYSVVGTTVPHKMGITSIASTSTGDTAIVCYADAVIKSYNLMNIENGIVSETNVLNPGLLEAWTVCISPTDDALAYGNHKGIVNICSLDGNHTNLCKFETNKFVLNLAFSNSVDIAPKLAISSIDGKISILDISSQKIETALSHHNLPVRSLCFSPDSSLLYSASDDRHVSVYDLVSGQIVNSFSHSGMCLSVDASPDHRHFAVGCSDCKVAFWDLGMQKCVQTFDGHTDHVWSVKFDQNDPAGNRVASAGEDAMLHIFG